jgi:hypothetical protein
MIVYKTRIKSQQKLIEWGRAGEESDRSSGTLVAILFCKFFLAVGDDGH